MPEVVYLPTRIAEKDLRENSETLPDGFKEALEDIQTLAAIRDPKYKQFRTNYLLFLRKRAKEDPSYGDILRVFAFLPPLKK